MAVALDQSISIDSDEFAKIAKDLQGNILQSHGRHNTRQIFVRFKDRDTSKRIIKTKIARLVTSAAKQKADAEAFKQNRNLRFRNFFTFSLSAEGYKFLKTDEEKIPSDARFRDGMRGSRNRLNDPRRGQLEKAYRDEWHALLIIANSSPKRLARQEAGILHLLNAEGILEDHHTEIGTGITNKAGEPIEHFGYVDGISQPLLLQEQIAAAPKNNWDPSANLDLALVKDPAGASDDSLGSYLIFRKLEQNVKAFKEAEAALGTQLGVSSEVAGAQMVGRFRSGAPLIPISPPQPGSAAKMNDFNYDGDPSPASRCPFHSHIRKTNPRGGNFQNPVQRDLEKTHLFVRRGITYGEDFTQKEVDPTGDVGLLFMAYNSNIATQFEFMQISWANDPNFPFQPGSHGIDPIVGQGSLNSGQKHFKTWGDAGSETEIKPSLGGFVKMLGGDYFFTPSISGLKNL